MANRRLEAVDIRTLLMHLRAQDSDRRVSRETKVARVTVRRYREWAQRHGLMEGAMPCLEELQRLLDSSLPRLRAPQNESSVEPFRELVLVLRREQVEMKALWHRLRERGYEGSYSSVYRFVKTLEASVPEAVVRVETPPGEEAQVDFGELGRMLDGATGQVRRAWAFVMTLSWSRHQYVEAVFDQKVATWLGLHVRAFEFFGGCPRRITTDNLKAAIIKASWHDPQVNRAYGECAEHYGFLIAPCRPRTPQHKGKVESGVHYVKRNFMAGRSLLYGQGQPLELQRTNQELRRWCLEEAGTRCHGTTREAPLARFETERGHLQPLPLTAYDVAEFKQVKLHRDCHVVFDNSYYSAPCRLIGQQLWVRGGLGSVRLYDEAHQCVATHDRSARPGQRQTHPDHLPPYKLPGLLQTRQSCLAQASDCGPHTLQLVQELLGDSVLERLPTAGRLVRLATRFSAARLEAACGRAISFGDFSYGTVKRILEEGLEQQPLSVAPAQGTPATVWSVDQGAALAFARNPHEILGHLWNQDTAADTFVEGVASWS